MNTPTTHCQVCGRAIKANTGTIAHHGYKRPGSGWQTASCYGAKHVPYEVGHDALDRWIVDLKVFIPRVETQITDHITNPPTEMIIHKRDAYGRERPGYPKTVTKPEGWVFNPNFYESRDYGFEFCSRLGQLRRTLRDMQETLAYATLRREAWNHQTVTA